MARTRLLHPDAPIDEDIASLRPLARLVWAYLPCHADREGRLSDKPFTLKLAILPTDDCDMNQLLDELAARGLIRRYEVDGRRYIAIRSFLRYQNPHKNEAASEIPPPPAQNTEAPKNTAAPSITRALAILPERSGGDDPDPVSDPVIDPVSDPVKTRAVARLSSARGSEPNLFDRMLRLFCGKWEHFYGEPYVPTPKDKSQLGRVIGQIPADHEQVLGACFSAYLADASHFVAGEQRHSLAWFCTSGGLNKYRTAVRSAGLNERERRGVQNAQAWIDMHEGRPHGAR